MQEERDNFMFPHTGLRHLGYVIKGKRVGMERLQRLGYMKSSNLHVTSLEPIQGRNV